MGFFTIMVEYLKIIDLMGIQNYEAAINLCSTSFCVPVMDQYSSVAISIALEVHWHQSDVKHTGIEAILRKMLCSIYKWRTEIGFFYQTGKRGSRGGIWGFIPPQFFGSENYLKCLS